jgi:hypothetical protein
MPKKKVPTKQAGQKRITRPVAKPNPVDREKILVSALVSIQSFSSDERAVSVALEALMDAGIVDVQDIL